MRSQDIGPVRRVFEEPWTDPDEAPAEAPAEPERRELVPA